MQIEDPISLKSAGILYNFSRLLQKNNTTLLKQIQHLFGYAKERFRKQEFTTLIKSLDTELAYSDIDTLWNELDQDGNNFIFFTSMSQAIKKYKDRNPLSRDSKIDRQFSQIMTKSQIRHSDSGSSLIHKQSQEQRVIMLFKQLKDKLQETETYQVLDIFDMDRDGHLSEQELRQLLIGFDIENEEDISLIVRKMITSGRGKISFQQILELLDLKHVAQRINFDQIAVSQSMIKSKITSSSKNLDKVELEDDLDFSSNAGDTMKNSFDMKLEKIPEIIEPYFNYSSQLSEPLTSMAVACFVQQTAFRDLENPNSAKAFRWLFVTDIFHTDYDLFTAVRSAIDRGRKGLGQLMEAKNINQGGVGDCYLMSAIAGVVENYPQLIYRMFVLDKNPASIYGVRLFVDGEWETVVTDAFFPVNRYGQLIYAKPQRTEIWVMILEKAWAKLYKSYQNIHAGYSDEGLTAITGAPCINMNSEQPGGLERLKIALKKGYIISCSGSDILEQMTPKEQESLGIYSGHAYSLLKIQENLEYKDRTVTLLKVRNPWGTKQWKGDWGFNCDKWIPVLRRKLGYQKHPNDGSFYMSLEDFMTYFRRISICSVSLSCENSSLRMKSSRNQSVMAKFTVTTKGDYYLSIYQESRRKYQHSGNYNLSKSRMFLAKVQNGKVEAVASKACIDNNLHIQTTLEPGEYMVSCKVAWNYKNQSQFILASYGPQKINFYKIPKHKPFIREWIESRSNFEIGEKAYFTKFGSHLASSYRIVFSEPREGYGYILIRNNSPVVFEVRIVFSNVKGIKPVKPDKLPLQVVVVPGETVVRPLTIDSAGFSYSFKQYLNIL